MVVIEGLAFGVRNATSLAQLSGLNYMIRTYLWENNLKFLIVAPTSLKKFITTHGNAKKEEMMMEVFNKYHVGFPDDNVNDAFCLAVVGRTLMNGSASSLNEKEVIDKLKKQQYDTRK